MFGQTTTMPYSYVVFMLVLLGPLLSAAAADTDTDTEAPAAAVALLLVNSTSSTVGMVYLISYHDIQIEFIGVDRFPHAGI